MELERKQYKREWGQLLVLMGMHLYVDMFGGMLASLLPAVRSHFGLTLTAGVALLTVSNLTANGMQLVTGYLRRRESKPLFLPLGLFLCTTICLLGLVPQQGGLVWVFLSSLVFLSAAGIAVIHPEALRSVHILNRIPASITTSIFLVGGYLGYSSGGWIAATLVVHWGWNGLLVLPIPAIIFYVLIRKFGIQLSAEGENGAVETGASVPDLSFYAILMTAIPNTTATTIFLGLLPTWLNEMGFELEFGGLSPMMAGIGGVVGSLFWGYWGHRRGELKGAFLSTLWAVPFLILYLCLANYRWAIWILPLVGFGGWGTFPLLVSLARHVRGPTLGQRMALMLGGSWGTASIVLMLMGPVAECVGVGKVLYFTWLGYLVSGIVGILLYRKIKKEKRIIKGPQYE